MSLDPKIEELDFDPKKPYILAVVWGSYVGEEVYPLNGGIPPNWSQCWGDDSYGYYIGFYVKGAEYHLYLNNDLSRIDFKPTWTLKVTKQFWDNIFSLDAGKPRCPENFIAILREVVDIKDELVVLS